MSGQRCLLNVLMGLAIGGWVTAQPGPNLDLRPIPAPDVTRLEETVREQITAAGDVLEKALQDPAVDSAALSALYGQLGRVYHSYDFPESALACYRNARFLAPGDYRWHHYLGVLYSQAGEVAAAELSFDMALAIEPSDHAARVLRGELFLDSDQLDLAEKDFRRVLENDPSLVAAIEGLGRVMLKRQSYPEALELFQSALRMLPSADSLHYQIAQAYRGMGELDSAREHLDKRGEIGVQVADPLMDLVRSQLQGEVVHLLRGRQAFNAGDFEGAVREFEKALQASPDSVRSRVNLASALTKVGGAAEARMLLEEVLAMDPGNNTARFNLGSLAYFQGDFETAVKHLQDYRDGLPDDPEATRVLGLSLASLGRGEEALPLLRLVNQNAPQDEPTRLSLVNLLLDRKEFAQAVQILRDANQAYPSQGLTALALARLLAAAPVPELRNGQEAYGLALQIYQAQSTPLHAATLALALAEMGRCESAVRWQQTAVTLAEKQQNTELVQTLSKTLEYYRSQRPCRPGS